MVMFASIPGAVVIKKYSNRRLYDTRDSRYITLEDLATVVQGGAAIKVVDAANGQDLTRQVLTQVILEQQDRLDMIPIELLHAIIRVQGTLQQAPLSAMLVAFTQQFAAAGALWTQRFASQFGAAPVFPFPSSDSSADAGSISSAAPANGPETHDLLALRERLDELLGRLEGSGET